MPIPILQALQVEREALPGGSTKPSLMLVADGQGRVAGHYVVKVCSPRNAEQYQPTAKEVYCHILAKEFDLIVPDAALVWVDEAVIGQLPKDGRQLVPGYYFGSRYLPDAVLVQAGISDGEVANAAHVFAFDVLIRNMDRTIGKPNLLLRQRNAVLIDHELALDIRKPFRDYWALGGWQVLASPGKQQHLLFERLCVSHRRAPLNFEEFSEYLHRMSLNGLHLAHSLLSDTGNPSEQFPHIVSYLKEAQRYPSRFIDLLKSLFP
jgi:hypothetical protein